MGNNSFVSRRDINLKTIARGKGKKQENMRGFLISENIKQLIQNVLCSHIFLGGGI